ncbi:hypothetical protein Zmor_013092 [Zophobas morio]|uniref:Uncharacterized protein n=1 Tax=Zophobas morio TaxID=2755281 RepID=A0AA38IGQ0_9CUCU|nr:hypothetical protein Zmor_013092 [Zophobas morio]
MAPLISCEFICWIIIAVKSAASFGFYGASCSCAVKLRRRKNPKGLKRNKSRKVVVTSEINAGKNVLVRVFEGMFVSSQRKLSIDVLAACLEFLRPPLSPDIKEISVT